MRLRAVHILLLLTVLAGCGRPARVIPEKKLIKIYYEMFLGDQWVRDHSDARTAVDTLLFFDPIFSRYGYSFKDYDKTVNYYLDRPEKYSKLINKAADRLRKEGADLKKIADAEDAYQREIEHLLGLYRKQDFTTDSLRWENPRSMWPVVAMEHFGPLKPRWDAVKPPEPRTAPKRVPVVEIDKEQLRLDLLER